MDISSVSRREVLRYLGYRGQAEPDRAVADEIEMCLGLLAEKAEPRHRVRSFLLELGPEQEIRFDRVHTSSRQLSKNLAGCGEILVFAATLGLGTDYLIQRYNRLQMSRAVILQAAAAAMIEEYCDRVCRELKAAYEAKGLYLRPRFSPGYGDFPLECQPYLLECVDGGKQLGIRLTGGYLMMPSKSVTAVMGLGRTPCGCEVKGCEACGKKDCAYRRQTGSED